MSRLVSNGKHLYYRRVIVGGEGGISHYEYHLVRTPIRKQIFIPPSAIKYYAVAGSYIDGEPAGGFVVTPGGTQSSSDYIAASAEAGRQMRNAAISSNPSADQHWRDVDANYESAQRMFVFYDGGWNCSYRTGVFYNQFNPSAYMQIPAHYFEIPATWNGWGIEGITLHGTYNGSIIVHQKANGGTYATDGAGHPLEPWYNTMEGSALPVQLLASDSDWRVAAWPHQIGLYQDLTGSDWQKLPNLYANVAHDSGGNAETVSLPAGVAYEDGQQISATAIWHGFGTRVIGDGLIPILAQPQAGNTQLGAGMIQKFSELHSGKRGGWLVCLPNINASAGGAPDYTSPGQFTMPGTGVYTNGPYYWLSCSYYFTGITVNLILDPP